MLPEQFGDVLMTFLRSKGERGPAVIAPRVDVCAAGEQQPNHFRVAI